MEVSNQMLELYEQNRIPQSQGSEVEGAAVKVPATSDEQASKQNSSHSAPDRSSVENNAVPLAGTENQSNEGSTEVGSDITDHKMDLETRDSQTSEKLSQKDNQREVANISNSGTDKIVADKEKLVATKEAAELGRSDGTSLHNEAIKMMVKDKVRAALEKRKKERGQMTIKEDVMDDDDLIERALEDGIQLDVDNDKNKPERSQSWSKPDNEDLDEAKDRNEMGVKGKLRKDRDGCNAEEGEMIDGASSLLKDRKRKKMDSPPAS